MDLKLQDKSALISGSTKGIGFAIAALLAAEGAKVIVSGRTQAAVKEALDRIRAATPKA
jgi:NAD(P)-dependent dehydrogenase (short-subunit alcohol dehydrogenase family)